MTLAQDPGESVAHLRDAKDYLDSAEDDFESLRFKPAASNACLSTIRSSDAVCVAELGQRRKGRSPYSKRQGRCMTLLVQPLVGQVSQPSRSLRRSRDIET